MVQLSQLYVTTGKTIALTIWTFVSNFSAFQHTVYVCHHFPAKKQSSSDFTATITIHSDFGAKKRKCVTTSTFPPFICHAVGGGCTDLTFLKYLVWSLLLHSHQDALNSSLISVIRVVSSMYLRLLMFLPPTYLYILQGSLPCHGERACITQLSHEPCQAGPAKMDVS